MVVSAIGSVRYASSVVMMSGHVKLFHAPINEKIATVSIEDFTSGNITERKILKLLAPSICADSISSVGTDMIAFLMTNTLNAVGSGEN